jgi:hypothetical protein
MRSPLLTCCLVALLAPNSFSKEFELSVTAPNGKLTRSIVSMTVSADFPESGLLRHPKGDVPFQTIQRTNLVFVLQSLNPEESRSFQVEPGKPRPAAVAQDDSGRVSLSVGEKRVITYQGPETEFPRPNIKPIYKRGAYIHPVFSPGGKLLTDDFPTNHIHHHGIWFPWTKTVFEGREPDFWNMGEGKGKVEFVELGDTWSGPVAAGFTTRHRFIDLTSGQPKAALNETWTVTTYSIPGADYFVLDLVSIQTCATASPLSLPKYYYGGLGFRGNWDWNGESKCFFLTSNGETDRLKGNETRGNWCHIGGEVNGDFSGMAIFCHPGNFRAPQPMRLHPKEPFFCFAPSQLGDWSIEPDKPYVSKYRFIIKDGRPDKSELDALWESYARPPQVRVISK